MNSEINILCQKLLDEIVNFDHQAFRSTTPPDQLAIPSLIPAGANDGGYFLSRMADELLSEISKEYYSVQRSTQEQISAKEFRNIVGAGLGRIISELNQDTDISSVDFERLLTENIEDLCAIRSSERYFYFGATILHPPKPLDLSIGPCRILDRNSWLNTHETAGIVPTILANRIRKRWAGQRCRPLKDPTKRVTENALINAIGDRAYVISVETYGPSTNLSRERALQCGRLALTALAFCWRHPHKVMPEFNLEQDSKSKLVTCAHYDTKSKFMGSSSHSLYTIGATILEEHLDQLLSTRNFVFEVVGACLSIHCGITTKSNQRELLGTIYQFLCLFHKSSIEPSDLFATMYLGACIDMLAGGKGSGGIAALIEKQLGKQKQSALFKDGTTVDGFIEQVYKTARSRTLHGSNPDIKTDWSTARVKAEQICRILFFKISDAVQADPNIRSLAQFRSLK